MSTMEDRISEILNRPYSRVITPEADGTFSAQISEFPGCFSYGDNAAEAYANLEEAAANWLNAAMAQGMNVPEPMRPEEASGRFALRMPRTLHARLTRAAALEEVSLNQFIVSVLAERAGADQAAKRLKREFSVVVQSLGSIVLNQRQEASTTRMISPQMVGRVEKTSGTLEVMQLPQMLPN